MISVDIELWTCGRVHERGLVLHNKTLMEFYIYSRFVMFVLKYEKRNICKGVNCSQKLYRLRNLNKNMH